MKPYLFKLARLHFLLRSSVTDMPKMSKLSVTD